MSQIGQIIFYVIMAFVLLCFMFRVVKLEEQRDELRESTDRTISLYKDREEIFREIIDKDGRYILKQRDYISTLVRELALLNKSNGVYEEKKDEA